MEPGTIVGGKYRLVEVLGRGASGVVWAARHEKTDAEFVVRVLSVEASDDAGRERVALAARASARIRHENVLEVQDVGETNEGRPFLVMRRARGETLAAMLRREGRLDPALAIDLAAQLARALEAAHAAGVVHRDVKPANVFLDEDEEETDPVSTPAGPRRTVVRLSDFGSSKLLDATRKTIEGWLVGSPGYMSPEQAEGREDVDARTDVWSLGVVLFEMVTGSLPFEGTSVPAVLRAVTGAPVPDPRDRAADVPDALAETILGCLERDRDRRVSLKELRSALTAIAAGEAPPAPRPRPRAERPAADESPPSSGAPSSAAVPPGVERWRAAVAVLALVLGVALIAVWVGRCSQPAQPVASAAPTVVVTVPSGAPPPPEPPPVPAESHPPPAPSPSVSEAPVGRHAPPPPPSASSDLLFQGKIDLPTRQKRR